MSNGTSYRRGSVFGALLLIAVGTLFLYANLTPGFSAWPFVARYWPILIIFWGLSKLTDYLMLRGTPEAARAARINAGDLIGLFFLLLIGSVFSAAVNRGVPHGVINIDGEELGCLFGEQFEYTEEMTREMVPDTTLSIDNDRGDLAVTAIDGAQLHLQAHKVICASNEEEARRLSARLVPSLDDRAGGVNFRWETPGGSPGLVSADITLEVPRALSLRATGKNGDVTLTGLKGDAHIEWAHGDAAITDVGGSVNLQMRGGSATVSDVRGNVTVEGRGDDVTIRTVTGDAAIKGEFYGPLVLAAIDGAARFDSRRTNFSAQRIGGEMTVDGDNFRLRGVAGDVSLVTRNKEIETEGVTGAIRIENKNGRVVIRSSQPPGGPIEVQNDREAIELVLPAASSFQLSATARKGEVETDFKELERQEQSGGTETLSGSVGGGRTTIRLNTSYGTISVRRSG